MDKKIKILYLITGLHTGGAEMVVKNLAERLNPERFDTIVVCIAPKGSIGFMMTDNGVKVVSLNAKFKYNPFLIIKLFKILKREKPDILHTHLFHADTLGKIVGRLAKVPKIITTFHNINIGGKGRDFLMYLTRDLSDYNIAVSKAVFKNALAKKMLNEKETRVIYNGIDLIKFPIKNKNEMRKQLGIPLEKKIFISVGSLTRQKGYECLIKAVTKINNLEIMFIILGEGPERNILEKQILDNDLIEKVVLKGNVINVGDYLQAADIFIMPSLWEGFSIALLEAMISGKVVIATDVGGNSEVVDNGVNGFLINKESIGSLIEKINFVLDLSNNDETTIIDNAVKTVQANFSIDVMILKHEYLYREVLNNI